MDENESLSAGYVCGVLCSDGKVVWNEKNGNYSISLETKNKEFADIFMVNLSNIIEKNPRIGTHKRKYNSNIIHMNTITVYGKSVIEQLIEKWDLKYGSRTWDVPSHAWNDIDFRKGFIKGFCDGNASISVDIEKYNNKNNKKRSVIIYSVNKDGLLNLQKLFMEEGIKSLFYPAGECFAIKISGKTRLELFRDRIGFSTKVKKTRLDDALLPLSIS